MAAYVIADLSIHDPAGFETYRQAVPSTITKYGGKYMVRGGKAEVLEGDWRPSRIVILEFESVDQAKRWYQSPEYQAVLPSRLGAAESKVLIVEGI